MGRGRLRHRTAGASLLLSVLAMLWLGTTDARAATDTSSLATVRSALADDPVYLAPDAEGARLVDAGALRSAIGDAPIVVAVLPTQARTAAPGGSVDALPGAIGGRRAVVVLCGRSLRAGASTDVLPTGRAGQLARQAQADHAGSFNQENVQGALAELVTSLRKEIARGNGNGSGSGSSRSAGTPVWPWVLGGLVLVGGGGGAYMVARRRRRAREQQQQLATVRAEVQSLYERLGADVSTLDPGTDPVARQALADAAERYNAAGALLSRASSDGEVAAAGHAAAEGLHASRVARERLGLDPGPPIPEPQRAQPALDRPREVQVDGASYQGYPSYAPGAPNYFPGGTIGGGYVPGGWYGSRFWEGALVGGLAGTVLAGGLGGYGLGGFGMGGFGWGGYGSGYGMGYGSGYDSGYEAGLDRGGDNGGDWSGSGDPSGGDWSGGDAGGDWGAGDSGGGDWGGGDLGGGGDFGGNDSGGGGDW